MPKTRKPRPPKATPPASWEETIDRFDRHLTELERSDHTRRDYRADLELFEAWYRIKFAEEPSIALLQAAELREFKAELRDNRKLEVNTVNRKLAALRSLLRWAEAEGIAPEIRGPKSLRQTPQPPRWLEAKELRALRRTAERYGGQRDAAVIDLVTHTGLRVEELVELAWRDVEIGPRSGKLTVRKGKGRKQRAIPLNPEARKALIALQECNPLRSEKVLNGQRGPLNCRAVQLILSKLSKRAGLPPLSPHDLRHTFGHNLAVEGVSIQEIADLMGHESLETTRRYVQPGREDLQKAVDRLAGGPEDD